MFKEKEKEGERTHVAGEHDILYAHALRVAPPGLVLRELLLHLVQLVQEEVVQAAVVHQRVRHHRYRVRWRIDACW